MRIFFARMNKIFKVDLKDKGCHFLVSKYYIGCSYLASLTFISIYSFDFSQARILT